MNVRKNKIIIMIIAIHVAYLLYSKPLTQNHAHTDLFTVPAFAIYDQHTTL